MIRVINVYKEEPFIYTLGTKVNEELMDLESRGWNVLKLDYYESRIINKKIAGYFITIELNEEKYIKTKSTDELVEEVFNGFWGDEEERKKRLGKRYTEVQNKVNEIIYNLALEVLDGKHGNAVERVSKLGNKYEAVQNKVNEILNSKYKKSRRRFFFF